MNPLIKRTNSIHRRVLLFVGAAALTLAAAANAFENGGFENGLAGWTLDISGGHYALESGGELAYPFPWETNPYLVNEVAAHCQPVAGGQAFPAVSGSYFLELYGSQWSTYMDFTGPDGQTWYFALADWTVSLHQHLLLEEGDRVTGWATFGSTDYPGFADAAWISIGGDGVWAGTIDDVYGSAGTPDWQPWEWTAPANGFYLLSLNLTGDDEMGSWADFDDIRIEKKVPEAGPGLFGIVGGIGLMIFARGRREHLRRCSQ